MMVDPERLTLYRYLSATEANDHVAIMGLFANALLPEWSAEDVADQGVDLPAETIQARCKYLADNGNLLVSPRQVRVTSIAEYQSRPVRYTVSALGARLHREVEVFLALTGGAREVPRELLALVADGLVSLDLGADPESLAGAVSTIFGQFHEFAASVTDFYTYIGAVLTRSDLDGDEWAGFKHLLLDYLESIVESVRRHTPAINAALERLRPEVPVLLERITDNDGAFAALQAVSPGGEEVQRARGRSLADWDQLEQWFAGPGARQLRDAAHRAVGALLTSLKRINASAIKEASLRKHFLKLAGWFDASTPAEAHMLASAAFGLYGARHLGVPLDDAIAEAVPASMSWWRCPPAPVPVALRERGDRVARGRAARPADHGDQKARLWIQRAEEAERRAAACAELLAVGPHLAEARLSGPAMRVLLELLATATAGHPATLPDFPVTLHFQRGKGSVVLRSDIGNASARRRGSLRTRAQGDRRTSLTRIGGVMSEQFFTVPAPSTRLLPAERFDRWVLHRAGIVNVWQYDRAELAFGGGRALLRGRNGGKSKALEILLPFVLDGDTRAIDTSGRDRTSLYWLMTDGREPGNHVGYVWLELRMATGDGEDRFCTIGAGLKAATATRQATTWFFMTEDARVGIDLDLSPDVSIDKLKERLGPDAVTTAVEHRRRVAARLFGLHDAGRFSNLVHLLHRLRDPNIGNKIDAGELATVLRDALPPPAEEALAQAAERFDTLDQVRAQLERTERTAQALTRFLTTYRGYARTALRDRSQRVLDADSERRRAERDAKRRADEAATATARRKAADDHVSLLRSREDEARAALESLKASDAYKQHLNLADRRRTVDAKAAAADAAEGAAASTAGVARHAADDANRLVDSAARVETAVHEARPSLVRLGADAGIDQAVIPRQAEEIPAAISVAEGRRRTAGQVRHLAEVAVVAKSRAERAEERAGDSERELADRHADADDATQAWVAQSRSWRGAVAEWPADGDQSWRGAVAEWPADGDPDTLDPPEGSEATPDWEPLRRALGGGPADASELAALPALARTLLSPWQYAARQGESAARSAQAQAERALEEKEAERAALEAMEESRPVASRFQSVERDEQVGAPFYQLVDVASGVSEADRAGVEAALEASGLLDAWVGHDGLVIHPSTNDVIVRTDAPPLADGIPTLSSVLVAERPEVVRVLAAVGLGPQEGHPWVAVDGRWSLGPLRGAWSKPEAEFLGAGTRRATRERRLAELTRQCAELRAAALAANALLRRRQAARERLDALPQTFPDDAPVMAAIAQVDATSRLVAAARGRHNQDRRAAEQARALAAQASAELTHAATGENLPVTIDALDDVIGAAQELTSELRNWRRAWDDLAERQAEVTRAVEWRRAQEADALAASNRATAARQEHEYEATALAALEAAVGATVAEVLAGIRRYEGKYDAARREQPAAIRRAQELAVAEGEAASRAGAAALEVDRAALSVTGAVGRLAKTVLLPGVYSASVDREWESGDVDVTAARILRSTVGDGGEISDQVVLNRLRELEDGLAGGYDVVFGEDDGVKYFHVVDDTGRQPLPAVAARVAAEAVAAKDRLATREREIIERFLLGELGEELRERLLEAHDLVKGANLRLSGVRSSHGKGAHLDWRIDEEAPAVVRKAAQLLVMSPRTVEEDTQLRDVLMALIRAQREKDPALSYLEHLREALDYRRWYRFVVQVVDDARPGSYRALSNRLGLSQGEQRVLSYLALFAAASAHYDGLVSYCPRLLLLDDAFAKVDEPTHGRLLELLVDLNLDFLITSERMWGCFPEVPSLEIYEALREPSIPGVALVHFRWDGQQRHLVGL